MASKYNLRVIRILTSFSKKKKKEVTVGLRPMISLRPFEKKCVQKKYDFKDHDQHQFYIEYHVCVNICYDKKNIPFSCLSTVLYIFIYYQE